MVSTATATNNVLIYGKFSDMKYTKDSISGVLPGQKIVCALKSEGKVHYYWLKFLAFLNILKVGHDVIEKTYTATVTNNVQFQNMATIWVRQNGNIAQKGALDKQDQSAEVAKLKLQLEIAQTAQAAQSHMINALNNTITNMQKNSVGNAASQKVQELEAALQKAENTTKQTAQAWQNAVKEQQDKASQKVQQLETALSNKEQEYVRKIKAETDKIRDQAQTAIGQLRDNIVLHMRKMLHLAAQQQKLPETSPELATANIPPVDKTTMQAVRQSISEHIGGLHAKITGLEQKLKEALDSHKAILAKQEQAKAQLEHNSEQAPNASQKIQELEKKNTQLQTEVQGLTQGTSMLEADNESLTDELAEEQQKHQEVADLVIDYVNNDALPTEDKKESLGYRLAHAIHNKIASIHHSHQTTLNARNQADKETTDTHAQEVADLTEKHTAEKAQLEKDHQSQLGKQRDHLVQQFTKMVNDTEDAWKEKLHAARSSKAEGSSDEATSPRAEKKERRSSRNLTNLLNLHHSQGSSKELLRQESSKELPRLAVTPPAKNRLPDVRGIFPQDETHTEEATHEHKGLLASLKDHLPGHHHHHDAKKEKTLEATPSAEATPEGTTPTDVTPQESPAVSPRKTTSAAASPELSPRES